MDNISQMKKPSKTEFFRIYPELTRKTENNDVIHKFYYLFNSKQKNEKENTKRELKKSSSTINNTIKYVLNEKMISKDRKSVSNQNSKLDLAESIENSETEKELIYDILDKAIDNQRFNKRNSQKYKKNPDFIKKPLEKFFEQSSIIENLTNRLSAIEATIKQSKKIKTNNTNKDEANSQLDKEIKAKVKFKIDNILSKLSERLFIQKIKKNKFVIKKNEAGGDCYFLLSGKMNKLIMHEYKGIKLRYRDYFIYIKSLLNYKEIDMLLNVLQSNTKFLDVTLIEDITRLTKAFFVHSLKEELKKKINGITISDLENFFKEYNFTLEEFYINKEGMLKEIKIRQEKGSNINIMLRDYIISNIKLPQEDEDLLNSYNLLNIEKEKRAPLVCIFRYENSKTPLYPGDMFGEEKDKKINETIRTEEDCYIGSLSYEYYLALISEEEKKLEAIDSQFILNNFFLKDISPNIFKKYYSMFEKTERKKNEVLYEPGDALDKIYLLKDGIIKTEIYANVKDLINLIKNIIKNLYLKSSNLKLTLNQIMELKKNYLEDDLIVETNENKDYILSDKVPKKLYNLFYSNGFECLGLLEFCLNIPYFTRCTVVSDNAFFREIQKDDLAKILQNDKEVLPEYFNFVHMNAISLTKRLYFLKSNLLKKITNKINDKNKYRITEITNNINNNHKPKIEIINSDKVKNIYNQKSQRTKDKAKFSTKNIMSNKFINNISIKKNTLLSSINNNTLIKEEDSSLFIKGSFDMEKSLLSKRRDSNIKNIASLKLNENEKNLDKNISVVNIRNKILSIDSIKKKMNEELSKKKSLEKLCIVSKYSKKEDKKSLIKDLDKNIYFEERIKISKNGEDILPSDITKENNSNNINIEYIKDNLCKTFRKESSYASLVPSFKSSNLKIKNLLKEMKRKQCINMGQTKFVFCRKPKINKVYNDLIKEQKSANNIKDYYFKKKIEGYSSIVNPMNNTYINRQKTFRVKTRRDFSN